MDYLARKQLTTQVVDLMDASARAHAEGRHDDSSRLAVEACALDVSVVTAVQGGIMIGEIPHPHRDPDGWAEYVAANREELARMQGGDGE